MVQEIWSELLGSKLLQTFIFDDGQQRREDVDVQVEDEQEGDRGVGLLRFARHHPDEHEHADGENDHKQGHDSGVAVNVALGNSL